ncbi:uncharacterized protein LOC110465088 [Mizuhopecten yessoensis]|uniref:Protein DBF4-like A n=1 Tax=Mizuhopecten yessoensis TaxID=6573 RepID=A0A210PSG1_MIZYE|nr:uncharacterized protein LOC110465088 [Mizuhopecten yessoensis]OWF39392.1 Protein DBF4-like A [Mizuhopecten yessoensis]
MKKPSNGKDTKNKGACPRGKRKLEYNDQKQPKLPLTGKLIYLDIKDIRLTKKLEADLKRLGSSVEKFFVKEINYLITSHPRPKQRNEDKLQSADSPAGVSIPSPFNCGPSPSPGAVETKAPQSVTRGKAILQKAQLQKKTSTIIENAEKWKVKIVSVEAALKWILKELAKLPAEDSKSNQSANTRGSKIKRLRSPMLKFESNTRQYRPVHGNLGNWPFANVDTPKGTCPFDGTTVGRGERSREERGDRIGLAQPMDNNMPASPAGIGGDDQNSGSNKTPRAEAQGKSRPSENQGGGLSGMKIMTAGDLKRRKEQKRIQERKRGYCECCQVKYDDLDKHVFQDQHKSFIREKKNYETLDHLIRTGPSTARFLQRVLLKHCTNHRTTDTNKSESDEEVLLITPGKAAAKAAANGNKPPQQLKSPRKGKQTAVPTDSNKQRSKEHREKRKKTKDSKPEIKVLDKQTHFVSKTSGSNSKILDDQSDKVEGNNSNQSKEDTSVTAVEEKKVCELKEGSKSNSVGPKVSLTPTKDSETLNAVIDQKNVDRSPEKRSYTSDGLDMKNHVVPVRTRNCLGVYPNMSPSRVSWACRQSLSADEDSQSGSNKPDKASCVRVLNNPSVAKENIPAGNLSLDNHICKDKNNKQPDCETKGEIPLAGDRIRVLRESRSRSKQGQQSQQPTGTSLRKEKRVWENLEDIQDNFDEVDGDNSSMTISKKSLALVESPVISLSPHTGSNVKCPDICSSPRKGRACRLLVKTVVEVESKNRGASSQDELDPSQVLDSTSTRTRRQSPVKDTKCRGKDEHDPNQVLDSTETRTRSCSPVKNTKCQGKAKLHSSQIIIDSVTTRTRTESPIKNTKCRSKAELDANQILNSTISKTRSRSPVKNTKCQGKDVLDASEVKDSVTTKTQTRSPVKDRNIRTNCRGRVKIDSTSQGVSTESNISRTSDKLCTGKPCEERPVQLLNSPRTRKKVINYNDEKHQWLESNDENDFVVKRVRSHSSKTRSEKYLNEVETFVDSEPVSPRKRLRSRESHPEPVSPRKHLRSRESHPAKDSQPTLSSPLKPDSTQDIHCSPALRNPQEKVEETYSGKVVSKKDSSADAKENLKCKNMKSSLTENMDNKQHRIIQSSTKVQIENSEGKSTATNINLNTSSAYVPEAMDAGFYVNCMEMVKKRSQMRQEAQKNRSNSMGSPHSSSSIASRLDGTPRKRITVTVSPVRSSKSAPNDSHQRQNVKSNTNVGSSTSINSPGVQGGNAKVQTETTTSAESTCRNGKKKSSVNLVRISSGIPTSGLIDGRNENRSKGSIITNPHPDGKQRHRPLHNDSKEMSSTGKLLSPTLHHKSDNFARSPSPLFNRSPKYNKSRKSHDKHHRKSSNSRVRKSVVYDPYDIRNLSPLKQGQNVFSSPRSGYSGETSRSKKKNRNWRPSQKHSSEVKSSNSKKLQKLKLPDPATTTKLYIETPQSDVTDSHLTREKDSNKGKTTRENVSEHRREVSTEKDQQSSKRRHSARQKLELDGNITGGKEEYSVPSIDYIPLDKLHGPADDTDDRFIAIKKLEISDLTIIEHEECELYSKKEKQSGGAEHSKKLTSNSAKHRKRKISQRDSGVGSCKEKNDKGHSKKVDRSNLKWQTTAVQMSPKAKTVKLNKSWTLLSDRSMAKILQSDGDDVPFEGFQPEHATGRSLLGSEMSYVETTEVELEENSDHEWELEHDEGVEEEEKDYIDYVNCTFTSPGKHTDSSWDETFDNYIDHQLNRSKPSDAKLNTSFNIVAGHSSPRTFGSPRRHRHQQRGLTPNKRKADVAECSDLPPDVMGLNHTPKRRKFNKIGTGGVAETGVKRVDEEIEFNYCSPQKLKVFSPQNKMGTEIVLSSSPLKCRGGLFTSTPHTARQNKKVSAGGSSLDLPALSDSKSQTGSADKVKTKSGHHRNKSTKTSSSQECSVGGDSSKQSHRSNKHRHKSHSKH